MQSPRGFGGALILLLGVPVAVLTENLFGTGAEAVLHFALGASFLLLAFSVFDFKLPPWIRLAACAATGLLAAVFLLQGVSDLRQSDPLRRLAYDVLGQRLEKMLGYAFLLSCVALVLMDSIGKRKILGATVLVMILCVEIYALGVSFAGGEAPGFLKLSYLPLFVWLLLESGRRRTETEDGAHVRGHRQAI